MKTFSPKKYLNNEITQKDCHHELLITSGFDEGMYGTTYKCMICEEHLHYGIYESMDTSDRYIYIDYGCLTPNNLELNKSMLLFISNRYKNEELIDIANIFNTINPELESIAKVLNRPIEKEGKRKRKVYHV